jgi:hypothetical protein
MKRVLGLLSAETEWRVALTADLHLVLYSPHENSCVVVTQDGIKVLDAYGQ